ncbi:hypothetical protein HYH03_002061 [Edaphochlamys debaryana]|uniref:Uncharacterized protein n=1 Tax=Edaphochlamys debaryana TaxID=47281 RepID=A0A836C5F1_9CHLO|nr:hypothetical protein HYH03_002061 [Edaphochlamys debaryana]|eukprot:KAG2499764.1 hypothetical protein HYH03_002061 [Edaphochlamys debaryana]
MARILAMQAVDVDELLSLAVLEAGCYAAGPQPSRSHTHPYSTSPLETGVDMDWHVPIEALVELEPATAIHAAVGIAAAKAGSAPRSVGRLRQGRPCSLEPISEDEETGTRTESMVREESCLGLGATGTAAFPRLLAQPEPQPLTAAGDCAMPPVPSSPDPPPQLSDLSTAGSGGGACGCSLSSTTAGLASSSQYVRSSSANPHLSCHSGDADASSSASASGLEALDGSRRGEAEGKQGVLEPASNGLDASASFACSRFRPTQCRLVGPEPSRSSRPVSEERSFASSGGKLLARLRRSAAACLSPRTLGDTPADGAHAMAMTVGDTCWAQPGSAEERDGRS